MSEIKGQLLGIVLVIAIFGAVAGVLMGAFVNKTQTVKTKIEADQAIVPSERLGDGLLSYQE